MVVLDCSAAFEMAKGSPKGQAFNMLLTEGEPVIAPIFFFNEAANVAWKLFSFDDLPKEKAMHLLENAVTLVDDFISPVSYYKEAFELACQTRHSVYDIFYLLLAKRNGATLFTVDQRLIKLCEQMGVNVVTEVDF